MSSTRGGTREGSTDSTDGSGNLSFERVHDRKGTVKLHVEAAGITPVGQAEPELASMTLSGPKERPSEFLLVRRCHEGEIKTRHVLRVGKVAGQSDGCSSSDIAVVTLPPARNSRGRSCSESSGRCVSTARRAQRRSGTCRPHASELSPLSPYLSQIDAQIVGLVPAALGPWPIGGIGIPAVIAHQRARASVSKRTPPTRPLRLTNGG